MILGANRQTMFRNGVLASVFGMILAASVGMPAFAAPVDDTSTPEQADTLLQRIDDCQTAINEANADVKKADRAYKKAMDSAKAAQAQIDEQEARIAELHDTLEALSVSLYKGHRNDNPLLSILEADTLRDLDDALDSLDTIASEEAQLIQDSKDAREKLERAKQSYDAHAEQAREEKQAAQEARDRAERMHDELIAEAAKITNDIADGEARRSLANAIAEKAFPKGSAMKDPCPGATVSSEFGYRDFDHEFHQGLDLAAAEGTPYYAAAGGTVIYATNDGKDNGGAGNWVVIAHGNGIVTKYMHSKRTLVKAGEVVTAGQHIGDVGQTGAAFGAHLHFQVEVDGTPVDPQKAFA